MVQFELKKEPGDEFMNVFLVVFGTVMGIVLLIASLLFTNVGLILSLIISMAGFMGPVFAGLNKKIFKE